MGTAVQQRSTANVHSGTSRPPGRQEVDINLLVLPDRSTPTPLPRVEDSPLTAKDANELLKSRSTLEKQLAEIDFRLSNNLEDRENLRRMKEAFSARPHKPGSLDAYLSTGAIFGLIGGIVALLPFAQSLTTAVTILLIPAGVIGGFLLGSIGGGFVGATIKDPYDENALVEKLLKEKGSPPVAALPSGYLNLAALFKLKSYKGPSSEAAREFDREILKIEESALPDQRRQMAREALLVERESVTSQLALTNSKLAAWEQEQKTLTEKKTLEEGQKKALEEASAMLKNLLEKLTVPPQADREYFEEVSEKSQKMIKALKEFRHDRLLAIPEEMPVLRYFASILSWLDKGQVEEDAKKGFFEKLESALCARLLAANRALGKATPGIDD